MRLNRELRTKSMVFRFHLLWVLFYVVLIGMVAAGAYLFYREHDEDRLPSGHIELSVNKKRYQPGETITFTVKNHFPTTVYVTNSCPEEPLNVYRWDGKRWKQVHATATRSSKCYHEPRQVPVPAEHSLVYSFKDWPDLFREPGVYRVVLVVAHYDDLPFQDFVVLRPAQKAPEGEAGEAGKAAAPPPGPVIKPQEGTSEVEHVELEQETEGEIE